LVFVVPWLSKVSPTKPVSTSSKVSLEDFLAVRGFLETKLTPEALKEVDNALLDFVVRG